MLQGFSINNTKVLMNEIDSNLLWFDVKLSSIDLKKKTQSMLLKLVLHDLLNYYCGTLTADNLNLVHTY